VGWQTETVGKIVDHALIGRYDIPEFQRGFVWKPDQLRSLLSSLYRDYPIGAMLVWEPIHEYNYPRSAQGLRNPDWIVDGQQRITALCLAFGKKPYWWADAESWNRETEKFDILLDLESMRSTPQFHLPTKAKRADARYLSIRDALQCAEDRNALTRLADEICNSSATDPGLVWSTLTNIIALSTRPIPIVSVQHSIEDVAEIFSKVNQAGTRVKEADVTLALLAAYNASWIRKEFLPFSRGLSELGFDLDSGILIKTISGIEHGTARVGEVPQEWWKQEITQPWTRAKRAISGVLKYLASRGLLSGRLIPSHNSLIPLFALAGKHPSTINLDRAFRWFLLANAEGRYSGAPNEILTKDLRTIHLASDAVAALTSLEEDLPSFEEISPERFLESYRGNTFGKLLLSLILFDGEASDWLDGNRIGYSIDDNMLLEGFLPDWHHIYPENVLKKVRLQKAKMDALANITILNKPSNRHKIRSTPPEIYSIQFNIGSSQLKSHFVPSDIELTIENYDRFIAERAELLADAANCYFKRLMALDG